MKESLSSLIGRHLRVATADDDSHSSISLDTHLISVDSKTLGFDQPTNPSFCKPRTRPQRSALNKNTDTSPAIPKRVLSTRNRGVEVSALDQSPIMPNRETWNNSFEAADKGETEDRVAKVQSKPRRKSNEYPKDRKKPTRRRSNDSYGKRGSNDCQKNPLTLNKSQPKRSNMERHKSIEMSLYFTELFPTRSARKGRRSSLGPGSVPNDLREPKDSLLRRSRKPRGSSNDATLSRKRQSSMERSSCHSMLDTSLNASTHSSPSGCYGTSKNKPHRRHPHGQQISLNRKISRRSTMDNSANSRTRHPLHTAKRRQSLDSAKQAIAYVQPQILLNQLVM